MRTREASVRTIALYSAGRPNSHGFPRRGPEAGIQWTAETQPAAADVGSSLDSCLIGGLQAVCHSLSGPGVLGAKKGKETLSDIARRLT